MLNYSPAELYFYFRFGCTTPLELIFLSDTFQFVIYTILSYPFAWVISRQKNEEKRKRLYTAFLLCCCVLPVIYIIYAIFSHAPELDEILGQIIMLAFWLLRMWLLLLIQVLIHRLAGRFGWIGTIGAAIFCAWGIYKLLDFFIAAYPEPAAIFPRYQWI